MLRESLNRMWRSGPKWSQHLAQSKKQRERERERGSDECGMLNSYDRYMKLNQLLT